MASILLKIRHKGNLSFTKPVFILRRDENPAIIEGGILFRLGGNALLNANAYELLSLAMRYVFAALMVLIVIRAWRITFIDNRRANKLRRLSPDTGIIGEMMVVRGGEKARPGMHYSVTLEGTIGSGRRSDIRVRHSTVKSRHAIYQMTEEGLFVRGHAHCRIRDGHGRLARQLVLQDGEILRVGEVALLLVLSDGGSAPEEIHRRILRKKRDMRIRQNIQVWNDIGDMDDSIFRPDADDLFESNPAGGFAGDDFYGANEPDPYDFFRTDDTDDDF